MNKAGFLFSNDRGGYFYQHELKGGRQYATTGLGVRFRELHLAGAYWLSQNEVLDGTFALQLGFQKYFEP